MKKQPCQVYFDETIGRNLDEIAGRYGMTKNTLLAAAAYELSRVPPEQLWERLARLSKEESGRPKRFAVGPTVEATLETATG